MNFPTAKKLNGKVIRYRNPFGVECIGKVKVSKIQKGQGPLIGMWGYSSDKQYPIKTVIINDLVGKDKVHGCWPISTIDQGHERFTEGLSKITLLEVLKETPSMRFSYGGR